MNIIINEYIYLFVINIKLYIDQWIGKLMIFESDCVLINEYTFCNAWIDGNCYQIIYPMINLLVILKLIYWSVNSNNIWLIVCIETDAENI